MLPQRGQTGHLVLVIVVIIVLSLILIIILLLILIPIVAVAVTVVAPIHLDSHRPDATIGVALALYLHPAVHSDISASAVPVVGGSVRIYGSPFEDEDQLGTAAGQT
jgi:uncharacterized SAM-binding protein YcdF (DUF218 family)